MIENPTALLAKRDQHIIELQNEADSLLQSKQKMEGEFKKQIAFFQWGQDMSEKKYTSKIQATLEEQAKLRESLAEKIEVIAQVERLQDQTLPWFHLMKELDRLVEEQEPNKESLSRNVPQPSDQALLLAKSSKHKDNCELRAKRVDHALLATHASMLHKEIERYEKLLEINEELGQFLKDLDIWSILKNSAGSASASSDNQS